jgi:hypothetical protein
MQKMNESEIFGKCRCSSLLHKYTAYLDCSLNKKKRVHKNDSRAAQLLVDATTATAHTSLLAIEGTVLSLENHSISQEVDFITPVWVEFKVGSIKSYTNDSDSEEETDMESLCAYMIHQTVMIW